MHLTVNGQPKEAKDGQSVRSLLDDLGLGGRAVAVEVNKKIVSRKEHEQVALHDGDSVEIVTLVGGG